MVKNHYFVSVNSFVALNVHATFNVVNSLVVIPSRNLIANEQDFVLAPDDTVHVLVVVRASHVFTVPVVKLPEVG